MAWLPDFVQQFCLWTVVGCHYSQLWIYHWWINSKKRLLCLEFKHYFFSFSWNPEISGQAWGKDHPRTVLSYDVAYFECELLRFKTLNLDLSQPVFGLYSGRSVLQIVGYCLASDPRAIYIIYIPLHLVKHHRFCPSCSSQHSSSETPSCHCGVPKPVWSLQVVSRWVVLLPSSLWHWASCWNISVSLDAQNFFCPSQPHSFIKCLSVLQKSFSNSRTQNLHCNLQLRYLSSSFLWWLLILIILASRSASVTSGGTFFS